MKDDGFAVSFDWPDDDDPSDERAARVGLDANALDRRNGREKAVDRFVALVRSGHVHCWIGPGVATEILRLPPETPIREIERLSDSPGRKRPLTAAQHISRIQVRAILCGNARPGKHDTDAAHLSEAAEAGCRSFITHDGRILGKRGDLQTIALPTMTIMPIDDYITIFDGFDL